MKTVALMLKAIHAQESKEAAREKAIQIAGKIWAMKFAKAAKKVEGRIEENLTYMDFSMQHWTRIQTNNVIERLKHEIKRRTKAIGAFVRRAERLDVCMCQTVSCSSNQLGNQTLYDMDHLFKSEEGMQSDIMVG